MGIALLKSCSGHGLIEDRLIGCSLPKIPIKGNNLELILYLTLIAIRGHNLKLTFLLDFKGHNLKLTMDLIKYKYK